MNVRRKGRVALDAALRSPDAKAPYVRRLFDTIASRYDLITRLLSFGRDSHWKRRLVRLADVQRGARALDLASGTGDIAFQLADQGARVVGLDITHRMLRLAREKRAGAPMVTGDMMSLPFPASAFDVVTAGYGLRNVPEIEPAIREIARVARPGARVLSLDFNRPSNAFVRGIYLTYLTIVGSTLGFILHGDPDTYRYIPESIRRYPGAEAVAKLMRANGFANCRVIPVLGGLMAIHLAIRD